jgi:hypothetical protein
MNNPAPTELVMRGITAITDNLPKGKGVNFALDFGLVFRREIAERFVRSADRAEPESCPASSISRSPR